jgi:putative ABC transport system permease protein
LILGVLDPKPGRYPIVGVVADTLELGLSSPVEPSMYFAGYTDFGHAAVVMIHTAGDPMAMAGVLRREVAALEAQAPVNEIHTMEEIADKSLAGRKFSVLLISMFGALALMLADGAGSSARHCPADGDWGGDEADAGGRGGGRVGGSVRWTGNRQRVIWSAGGRPGIVRGSGGSVAGSGNDRRVDSGEESDERGPGGRAERRVVRRAQNLHHR